MAQINHTCTISEQSSGLGPVWVQVLAHPASPVFLCVCVNMRCRSGTSTSVDFSMQRVGGSCSTCESVTRVFLTSVHVF